MYNVGNSLLELAHLICCSFASSKYRKQIYIHTNLTHLMSADAMTGYDCFLSFLQQTYIHRTIFANNFPTMHSNIK